MYSGGASTAGRAPVPPAFTTPPRPSSAFQSLNPIPSPHASTSLATPSAPSTATSPRRHSVLAASHDASHDQRRVAPTPSTAAPLRHGRPHSTTFDRRPSSIYNKGSSPFAGASGPSATDLAAAGALEPTEVRSDQMVALVDELQRSSVAPAVIESGSRAIPRPRRREDSAAPSDWTSLGSARGAVGRRSPSPSPQHSREASSASRRGRPSSCAGRTARGRARRRGDAASARAVGQGSTAQGHRVPVKERRRRRRRGRACSRRRGRRRAGSGGSRSSPRPPSPRAQLADLFRLPTHLLIIKGRSSQLLLPDRPRPRRRLASPTSPSPPRRPLHLSPYPTRARPLAPSRSRRSSHYTRPRPTCPRGGRRRRRPCRPRRPRHRPPLERARRAPRRRRRGLPGAASTRSTASCAVRRSRRASFARGAPRRPRAQQRGHSPPARQARSYSTRRALLPT